MAKLKVTNAFTGTKEDVTVGNAVGKIGWVVLTVILVAAGQNILGMLGMRTKLDTQIDPIIKTPAQAAAALPTYEII